MTVTSSPAFNNRVPLSDKKIKELFYLKKIKWNKEIFHLKVKCLDVATFSHMLHLEMSELISCVEIHTCMHAFICLYTISESKHKI
jgi:hypothetical protein